MIRRILTLGIAALAFWGGINLERLRLPEGCRAAGVSLTLPQVPA